MREEWGVLAAGERRGARGLAGHWSYTIVNTSPAIRRQRGASGHLSCQMRDGNTLLDLTNTKIQVKDPSLCMFREVRHVKPGIISTIPHNFMLVEFQQLSSYYKY